MNKWIDRNPRNPANKSICNCMLSTNFIIPPKIAAPPIHSTNELNQHILKELLLRNSKPTLFST